MTTSVVRPLDHARLILQRKRVTWWESLICTPSESLANTAECCISAAQSSRERYSAKTGRPRKFTPTTHMGHDGTEGDRAKRQQCADWCCTTRFRFDRQIPLFAIIHSLFLPNYWLIHPLSCNSMVNMALHETIMSKLLAPCIRNRSAMTWCVAGALTIHTGVSVV